MKPIILGLTGRSGAGKSTAAGMFAGLFKPASVMAFADPLKGMMAELLCNVASRQQVQEMLDGRLKETPIERLAMRTPRYLMQSLGTEWGRYLVDYDLWVSLARARMVRAIDDGRNVIFSDVRFENEAALILDSGGYIVRVERDEGIRRHDPHVSERYDCVAQYRLLNDGSLSDLMRRVAAIAGEIETEQAEMKGNVE